MAVSGDWARSTASETALAASMGLITNIDPDGSQYGNRWRVTPKGLHVLKEISTS